MVPTGFTVAVMEEATELFDLELPGEAIDDTRRDVGEVLKEGAKETGGAELDGKTQTAMVAAMRVDDRDRPSGSSGLTVPDSVLRRTGRSGSAVVRLGN